MSAPKVSEPVAQNVDEDEDVPELEDAEQTEEVAMPQRGAGKQPRKYAKVMVKMGLKPEENIMRVMIRKQAGMSFAIANPEVYRFPNTNTFVLFGETQVEDMSMGADPSQAAARTVTGATEEAPVATATAEDDDDDEEVDAGDIADKEIDVVMSQANVSRNKAIKALKNNNGDIVNAIMELTM